MEFIAEWFDWLWVWLDGIDDWFNSVLVNLSAWYVIYVTKAQIYFIGFSWQVAQAVLDQLNVTGTINQYWAQINPDIAGGLNFFRIPEALNMVMNSYLTRYVMGILR